MYFVGVLMNGTTATIVPACCFHPPSVFCLLILHVRVLVLLTLNDTEK